MKKYLYLCVSLSSSSLIDSNATPGGRRPPLQQHIALKHVCLSMCYVIMRLYWRSVVGAVSLLLLTGRGERWTHSCESDFKNTKCLTCFLLDLLRQNVEFVCLILRDLLSFSRHTTFWEINNVLKRTAEVKCTLKLYLCTASVQSICSRSHWKYIKPSVNSAEIQTIQPLFCPLETFNLCPCEPSEHPFHTNRSTQFERCSRIIVTIDYRGFP